MAIQPTLALIPAAQGSKFYSVLPSNGVGDFDFTRASTATRINSKGLIEEVASGVSRLDYTGGGCPHHLLEPQTTNLITQSNDFSDSSWIKSRSNISIDNAISPNGTQNADKLVEDTTTSNTHSVQQNITIGNVSLSGSIFVKADTRNKLRVLISDLTTGDYRIDLNLDNLTVVENNGGSIGSWTNTSYKIHNFSNDWYRVELNATKGAGTQASLSVFLLDDNGNSSYTGDGTSGVYIFGAQLEQSSYASSYIPTNGSTVTRLAETADNAGNAATFNDSEGVLFAEISALANGSFRYITLSDGTDSNNVQFGFFPLPKQVQFEVSSGGSSQLSYLDTNIDVLFNTKLLIKYKQNDFSIYVNGFEVHTDSSGLSPVGLDRICFDRGDGCGDNFYGKTKKLEYYNTTLTSLEMETLTSYTSFNEMALAQNYTI